MFRPVPRTVLLVLAACVAPATWAVQEANTAMPHSMDLAAQLDRDCSLEGTCVNSDRYGDAKVNYGPSRGYFPEGCRWREVFGTDHTGSVLEYWDATSQVWNDKRPTACTLQVRIPCAQLWRMPVSPSRPKVA
jgi:hypothetical protein